MKKRSLIRMIVIVGIATLLAEAPRSFAWVGTIATTQAMAEKKPATPQKPRPPRRRNGGGKGQIPKGVQACIDRLIQIAGADPLPEYGGEAEKIINDGLLWNDPKSRCSIGDNQSLRLKIAELVKAWRLKDASTARQLLQEIKSAAPQG